MGVDIWRMEWIFCGSIRLISIRLTRNVYIKHPYKVTTCLRIDIWKIEPDNLWINEINLDLFDIKFLYKNTPTRFLHVCEGVCERVWICVCVWVGGGTRIRHAHLLLYIWPSNRLETWKQIFLNLSFFSLLVYHQQMKWNDWCFRPRFCTVRLYWAWENLGEWDNH